MRVGKVRGRRWRKRVSGFLYFSLLLQKEPLRSEEQIQKPRARPPVSQARFSALKGAVIGTCCRCHDVMAHFLAMPKQKFPSQSKGQPARVRVKSWRGVCNAGRAGPGALIWTGQWRQPAGLERREIKHFWKHFGLGTFCQTVQDNIP